MKEPFCAISGSLKQRIPIFRSEKTRTYAQLKGVEKTADFRSDDISAVRLRSRIAHSGKHIRRRLQMFELPRFSVVFCESV